MANSTSIIYRLQRKILTFTNKISRSASAPNRKFIADMFYGILTSKSYHLTNIANQFHEPARKINSVNYLSRHLKKGIPASVSVSYLQTMKKMIPSDPVVLIDKSDVVKPDGKQFEPLGIVRDGSESPGQKRL